MIQMQTMLNAADNSGAKTLKCIKGPIEIATPLEPKKFREKFLVRTCCLWVQRVHNRTGVLSGVL